MGSSAETLLAMNVWLFSSVGMMVFNKMAIQAFPAECSLVALQMMFTVLALVVFGWKSLHIGSTGDLLRWLRIAPLFAGVLLTSILALKSASMTLVITFRSLAPLFAMSIERFFPDPLIVNLPMLFWMAVLLMGTMTYCIDLPWDSYGAIGWIVLNNGFVVVDRLMQRLMLAKGQNPVDISTSSCALLNNVFGLLPVMILVGVKKEYEKAIPMLISLDWYGSCLVALSCVVGCSIAYSGVWLQSMISATSFLVLATSGKFIVILIEVFGMRKSISKLQLIGASLTILAGVMYGRVREKLEAIEQVTKEEKALLVESARPV